ncbi:MAG: hypothetical protein F6J93_32705 [Oscillatoria sp. SIO1A7]|nr:hypothetical protein [Oscillatoria sp. SIO1A7]
MILLKTWSQETRFFKKTGFLYYIALTIPYTPHPTPHTPINPFGGAVPQ